MIREVGEAGAFSLVGRLGSGVVGAAVKGCEIEVLGLGLRELPAWSFTVMCATLSELKVAQLP